MKVFDFSLMKKIIKKFDDLEMLEEAFLGIEDDWMRTNRSVWKDGKLMWLPKNFKKMQEEFLEEYNKCRHQYEVELLLFNYTGICVKRVPGSEWSLPILQLHLKSKKVLAFECGWGEYTEKDPFYPIKKFKSVMDDDPQTFYQQIARMNIKVEKYSSTKTYKP